MKLNKRDTKRAILGIITAPGPANRPGGYAADVQKRVDLKMFDRLIPGFNRRCILK